MAGSSSERGGSPADDGGRPGLVHVAEADLPLGVGSSRVHAFRDERTGAEHLAVVAPGSTEPGLPPSDPLVRIHSECVTGDALGSRRCTCGAQLRSSLEAIARFGGAVVYLRGQDGRGLGTARKIEAYALEDGGMDMVDSHLALGHGPDERTYDAAVDILRHLGITHLRLLTNNPHKLDTLRDAGLEVSGVVALQVGTTGDNAQYVRAKRELLGHGLDDEVELPHRGPHRHPDAW